MTPTVSQNLATLRQMPALGQLTASLDACIALHQQHPSAEVEALLGLLQSQQGHLEAGRIHLTAALTQRETLSAPALTDLAGIHILLNEPVEALALLEQSLELQPDYPTARVRRGLVALQTGRWRLAIGDFEYGLAHFPVSHHGPIHANLGRAYYGLGQPEQALAAVAAARSAVSLSDPWPLYRLEVDALIALKRWEEAESVLRRALEAGLEPKRLLTLFTWVLAAQDKHDEAEHEVRKGLEQSPEDKELLLLLADLTQVRGRFGEALHSLKRAVELDPDNPELWLRMAQLGRRRFDPAWAREAAAKALALTETSTGHPRALALAAAAEVEEDEIQAETYYRNALEQFADCVPARLGLGRLLLQWGRVEEAASEFEKVAEHHPVAGYDALISARRFPDDPDILAKIEKLAYSPSLEGSVQSGLLFDLAASFEHLKDYPKAFAYAEAANRSSRKHLPYSADVHRERVQHLKKIFTADFYAHRNGFGHASTLPIFVLGMPRSGTTLVEQIIAGHPDIHGAGEIGCLSPVIHSMIRWEQHSGSGRGYPECVEDLTASEVLGYAEKILEHIQCHAPTARHIVDKLPHNFENIGLIRLLLPNAPVIHVLREPRDVALSNFFTDYQAKFGGMGFAYDLTDLGKHLVDYQSLMAHWDKVLPRPILTLPYEAVVDDVENAARTLLDYIGVAWDSSVLDFQNLDRAVKTASVWQVRQPIYKTSKAKWRRYAEFLAPLEAALAETLTEPAPEPATEPLPPGLFFEGMEYLKAGRGCEAEQVFRRLLSRYPNHAAATHFLGMAHYQQAHYLEALQLVRRSIHLHPHHADWHRNLALIEATATERGLSLDNGTDQ